MILQADACALPLADGVIDLLLADPPYGINFQSNMRTKTPKFERIQNDKRPFVEWLREAYRVMKPVSVILVFCRDDVDTVFQQAMQEAGFNYRRPRGIWDKEVIGMGDLKSSMGPCYETFLMGIKGAWRFPGKRPKSVFRVPRVPPAHIKHPNEKPVLLAKQLIEHFSAPGALVCDPFCGSGFAGVAAIETGRRFVGSDLTEQWSVYSKERLHGSAVSKVATHNHALDA